MFAMVGSGERRSTHKLYGFSDDVTMVRGSHQFGFGASTRYWKFDTRSTSRTGGSWTVDGSLTGHALADFLTGRVARVEIGGPSVLDIHNWYLGAYVQDAWRVSNRVTLNAGVRWEPYFGQYVENDAVVLWRKENFDQNIRSKVFLNAPPGLIYPGDEGFPDGKTGLNKQWWNLAPRAGVAWDVHGDGRLAVRSSYSMGYDFMAGEYHNINSGAPPFGNRSLITRSAGRHGRPLGAPPGWRSSPHRRQPHRGVHPIRRLWLDGSRHQFTTGAAVERDARAAARDQLGRVGDLSGQLLRPALGAVGAEPRGVPGPGPLHAQHGHGSADLSRCARSMAT